MMNFSPSYLIFVSFIIKCTISATIPIQLPCQNKIADVVFALDSSGSIHEEDFYKQLQFVANVVDKFSISKNGVHVGVTTFGSQVYEHIKLDDYYNHRDLKDAIRQIQYHGGATNTGAAIKHAREVMFGAKNDARENPDKIMFVITDGYSMDEKNTSYEASISKSQGVTIFAMGVGLGFDSLELRAIASKPDDNNQEFLFMVDQFKFLDTIQDAVVNIACNVMPEQQVEDLINDIQNDAAADNGTPNIKVKQYCGGKPADVYFAIDSSTSVWEPNFKKILRFVTGVVDMFDLGPDQTRVGVLTYSNGIHPAIPLDHAFDKEALKTRIMEIPFLSGSTYTGSTLGYLRERGFKRDHARDSVAHVIILITDGQSSDAKKSLHQSKLLHEMGVYIFALGIGDQVDQHELKAVASKPETDFVFEMQDFDALSSIKTILAIKTCAAERQHGGYQNDSPGKARCNPTGKIDIMYVFDAVSIGQKKTDVLTDVISDIITSSPSRDIRSGILARSCDAIKSIPLSFYRSQSDIMDELRNTQSDILPKLLSDLRTKSFDQQNIERSHAKKVAFLFVDGDLENFHQVKMAAKRIVFQNEIELFVVAIGTKVDTELRNLCTEPKHEHFIKINSYEEASTLKHAIQQKICNL